MKLGILDTDFSKTYTSDMASVIETPHFIRAPESYKKGDILIHNVDIISRLSSLSGLIAERYRERNLLAVGILKGGAKATGVVTEELDRLGLTDLEIDYMTVRSYGSGTVSNGANIVKDVSIDPAGRHVLLIDDIIDTGRTQRLLVDMMKNRNAASVSSLVVVDKRERRDRELIDLHATWTAFEIPDIWVEGFGMDTKEKGRAKPHIVIGENKPLISITV